MKLNSELIFNQASNINYSVNFVWIPAEKVPPGQLPIPNTNEAPFIANIKAWKKLNDKATVNLYIQKTRIAKTTEEDFFDNESLNNLQIELGSLINIIIMDRDFYEKNLNSFHEIFQKYDQFSYRDQSVSKSVFKKDFFVFREDINKHIFELYARVDFARLMVLAYELETKKSDFAIYSDADIVLDQEGIENTCSVEDKNILFCYVPDRDKSSYFVENQLMGFRKDALEELYLLLAQTAHELLNGKNGYDPIRFYSDQPRENIAKFYLLERSPARVNSIRHEIDQTILNSTIVQANIMSFSTVPVLELHHKGIQDMKLKCIIIQYDKIILDYEDLRNIIAYIKCFHSCIIDLQKVDSINTGCPSDLLQKSSEDIVNYLLDLLPPDYSKIFKDNIKNCTITGDQDAVVLFKSVFLEKNNRKESTPIDHIDQDKSFFTSEELRKIKSILEKYQSRSWLGFFWNTLFFGFFGKHYSQTMRALLGLVENVSDLTQVNKDKFKEAFQVESTYAEHRLNFLNNPQQENIHSGTDQVIYNLVKSDVFLKK